MKFFSNWDSHKTSNVIAFVSLGAVIVNFVCDGIERNTQRNKQKELEARAYLLNSLAVQPRLTIVGEPEVTLAVVQLFETEGKKFDLPSIINSGKTVDASGRISLKTMLHFRNAGDHLAKLITLVHVDTAGYSDRIRQIILAGSPEGINIAVKDIRKVSDILPKDTVSFEFETDLSTFDLHADTLHYFLLYQNELGNYFDTYVWVPFTTSEISYSFRSIPGTDSLIRTRLPANPKDFAKVASTPIEDFHTYTEKEAEKVTKFLNHLTTVTQ